MQKIKSVTGQEPHREGEYPDGFFVGHGYQHMDNKVSMIKYEEQNLGTYGIGWFVAYREDGSVIAKINAMYVVSVVYEHG